MKIAKRFRWEAAHRIPWHSGACANLHGHSYRMTVEVEGSPDEKGMVLDFKALKCLLSPLVKAWDHAILVSKNDEELLGICIQTNWKHYVVPFDTTAENLATCVADFLAPKLIEQTAGQLLTSLTIRLSETETCYAETVRPLTPAHYVTNTASTPTTIETTTEAIR